MIDLKIKKEERIRKERKEVETTKESLKLCKVLYNIVISLV